MLKKSSLISLLIIITMLAGPSPLLILAETGGAASDRATAGHEEGGQTLDILTPSADDSDDKTVENLFLSPTDVVVQGVTHRQDYYFEVPATRQVSAGSYMELFYGHSASLRADRSTMTIMLDDVPIGTRFLDQSSAKHSSWRHNLDELELEPGFHKLTLILHMEVTDNICMDQNNPANWFVLHKESVIHLRYDHQYERADLSSYPAPYVEKGSLHPYNTLFIVPDEPTANEWKGLALLARHFASLASEADMQVIREQDLSRSAELLRSHHLVWIGGVKSWKNAGGAHVREALAAAEAETAGRAADGANAAERANVSGDSAAAVGTGAVQSGVVHTAISNWNSDYDMLFVLGNDDGVLRAAELVTEAELYRQLAGSTATAALEHPIVKNESAAERPAGVVTLEDLGYNPLVIEGLMVGSARISYKIPAEWDVSRGGKLHIRFSHSRAIHFAESQAVLRINDIPVASAYLSEESSRFGTLEANIPPTALNGEYIVADISFQFAAFGEACSGIAQIGNWAVVHNDSYFSFTTLPNRDLNLKSLPYPFVTDSAWRRTAWLVPESPTIEELSAFASLNGLYGGDVHSYSELQVIPMPQTIVGDEAWLENHLIVTALAEKIPRWLSASATIPLAYGESGWEAKNEHVRLTDGLRHRAGVMQLFPSPLHEEANVLVMSGITDEDLGALRTAAVQRKLGGAQDGQVVALDDLARAHPFYTHQYEPVHSVWHNAFDYLLMENKPVLQRLLMIGAIIVVLALFAVIIWLFSRKKFRNGEEN